MVDERNHERDLFGRVGGILAALTIALLLVPAMAGATVTALSSGGSDGSLYPIIDGDSADDSIVVTCGTDGDVKINGLDPVDLSPAAKAFPIPCASMTAINVDGGAGNDTVDLSAMTRATGFTNPGLCAPCPNNGYSVVAECDVNTGNDTILSSSIGGVIGDCSAGTPMEGDDVIEGSDGHEAVNAGPGNDLFLGLSGDDYVIGGPGVDRLDGGPGADSLTGDGGRDRLQGGPGRDDLDGGPGVDRCVGGPGVDRIVACERPRGI